MAKRKRQSINNAGIESLAAMVDRADKCFGKGEYAKTASLCWNAIDLFGNQISKQALSKIYFTWVLALIRLDDYKPIEVLIDQAQNLIGQYLDLTFMNVMSAY